MPIFMVCAMFYYSDQQQYYTHNYQCSVKWHDLVYFHWYKWKKPLVTGCRFSQLCDKVKRNFVNKQRFSRATTNGSEDTWSISCVKTEKLIIYQLVYVVVLMLNQGYSPHTKCTAFLLLKKWLPSCFHFCNQTWVLSRVHQTVFQAEWSLGSR